MITIVRSAALIAAASFSVGAANAAVIVSNSTQGTVFSVSTSDLLQTNLASTTSTGNFIREGELGLTALTDGGFGALGSIATGNTSLEAATADASNSVTYTLGGAFNLTSIATYAGWDQYRGGQSYTVSYANAAAPTTFIALGSVFNDSTAFANTNTRAVITATSLFLATNVVAIKFDFNGDLTFGYAGYREIDVAGSAVPEPASWAMLIVGFGMVGVAARRRKTLAAA